MDFFQLALGVDASDVKSGADAAISQLQRIGVAANRSEKEMTELGRKLGQALKLNPSSDQGQIVKLIADLRRLAGVAETTRRSALALRDGLSGATDGNAIAERSREYQRSLQTLAQYQRQEQTLLRSGLADVSQTQQERIRLYRDSQQKLINLRSAQVSQATSQLAGSSDGAQRSALQRQIAGLEADVIRAQKRIGSADLFVPLQSQIQGGLLKSLSNLRDSFFGLLVAREVFQAITAPFRGLISTGVEFLSTMEQARLGIAGLIASSGGVKDAFSGLSISGVEALGPAFTEASRQIEQLRIAGLQTTATTTDLAEAFQQTVAAGARAGLTLDQVRKFTVDVVQAARALGLPRNQLAQEVRAILEGSIDRNARVAVALGISNEDIRNLKSAGTLADELNKRFAVFRALGGQVSQTFEGLKSNVEDAFQVVGGYVSKGLFDQLKKLFGGIFEALVDPLTGGIRERIKPALDTLNEIFTTAGTVINVGSKAVLEFLLVIGRFSSVIKALTFSAIIAGLSATFTALGRVGGAVLAGTTQLLSLANAFRLSGSSAQTAAAQYALAGTAAQATATRSAGAGTAGAALGAIGAAGAQIGTRAGASAASASGIVAGLGATGITGAIARFGKFAAIIGATIVAAEALDYVLRRLGQGPTVDSQAQNPDTLRDRLTALNEVAKATKDASLADLQQVDTFVALRQGYDLLDEAARKRVNSQKAEIDQFKQLKVEIAQAQTGGLPGITAKTQLQGVAITEQVREIEQANARLLQLAEERKRIQTLLNDTDNPTKGALIGAFVPGGVTALRQQLKAQLTEIDSLSNDITSKANEKRTTVARLTEDFARSVALLDKVGGDKAGQRLFADLVKGGGDVVNVLRDLRASNLITADTAKILGDSFNGVGQQIGLFIGKITEAQLRLRSLSLGGLSDSLKKVRDQIADEAGRAVIGGGKPLGAAEIRKRYNAGAKETLGTYGIISSANAKAVLQQQQDAQRIIDESFFPSKASGSGGGAAQNAERAREQALRFQQEITREQEIFAKRQRDVQKLYLNGQIEDLEQAYKLQLVLTDKYLSQRGNLQIRLLANERSAVEQEIKAIRDQIAAVPGVLNLTDKLNKVRAGVEVKLQGNEREKITEVQALLNKLLEKEGELQLKNLEIDRQRVKSSQERADIYRQEFLRLAQVGLDQPQVPIKEDPNARFDQPGGDFLRRARAELDLAARCDRLQIDLSRERSEIQRQVLLGQKSEKQAKLELIQVEQKYRGQLVESLNARLSALDAETRSTDNDRANRAFQEIAAIKQQIEEINQIGISLRPFDALTKGLKNFSRTAQEQFEDIGNSIRENLIGGIEGALNGEEGFLANALTGIRRTINRALSEQLTEELYSGLSTVRDKIFGKSHSIGGALSKIPGLGKIGPGGTAPFNPNAGIGIGEKASQTAQAQAISTSLTTQNGYWTEHLALMRQLIALEQQCCAAQAQQQSSGGGNIFSTLGSLLGLASGIGSAAGGLSGLGKLGGLFGGGGSGVLTGVGNVTDQLPSSFFSIFSKGSIFRNIPGLATGGPIFGPSIVGERGPELYIPRQSGFVASNNDLGRLLRDDRGREGRQSGRDQRPNVTVKMTVIANDVHSFQSGRTQRQIMRDLGRGIATAQRDE